MQDDDAVVNAFYDVIATANRARAAAIAVKQEQHIDALLAARRLYAKAVQSDNPVATMAQGFDAVRLDSKLDKLMARANKYWRVT